MSTALPSERLAARRAASESPDRLVTRAHVGDAVLMIGRAILLAVIILIVLGELYAAQIVAEPWVGADPTATVSENQTVAAGGLNQLNVTADWYYDNGTHAETVTNATSGATLTEGTDYEFYTNGSIENLAGSETKMNVTYSYFNQNTFQALTATFASYGETAYIMVGLGLIALGASVALSFFGAFSRDGGR